MHTPERRASDPSSSDTALQALKLLAGGITCAGLALALAALGLTLWETLERIGHVAPYFLIREWVASPTMLLLVFTMFWIERLVTLYRFGQARLARMRYSMTITNLIGRGHQWMSLLAAWISGTIALHRLIDLETTVALLTSVLTFGLSMWLLEGVCFKQAIRTRESRREGVAENEAIGC